MPQETTKPATSCPGLSGIPPTAYPELMEVYSPERIAEFLLNNAVNPADYAAALEEVRKLGLDPSAIPHEPPRGA